jgi:hypothetical protein
MFKNRMLSLDPGGTTGLAIVEWSKNTEPEIIKTAQVNDGLHGFLRYHWDELEKWPFDRIVCESFTLREGVYGVDLSPVYIIGALEALYPAHEIIYQEPHMKPLCDDDRLKKMGIYEPGRGHAMDAVRHSMINLRNEKHNPTLMKGWA